MSNGFHTSKKQLLMAGLVTRTVARSPVVRWILHARIRRKRCNDVVFVGDDFIEVRQVMELGHLEHIATKNNFDCRIRAAKTFSNITQADEDEDFFIKTEDEAERIDTIPPQCIVLTTDANELLFIYLADDKKGLMHFVHQAVPLPVFDKWLFQPGEHLAIDPYSRAMAVAANEREIIIYAAKPKDRIEHELRSKAANWCPVSAQRPLQIDGVIEHMDFLFPPLDDNGVYNEDHIILLLIVRTQRGTRVHWMEWFHTDDLHHVVPRGGERLEAPNSVANLLIPLHNTRFLLIHGSNMTTYKDILCGAPRPVSINSTDTEWSLPLCPGASPRKPIWANWCRPIRGSAARNDTDHLYLIREDGRVFLFSITGRIWEQDHAGDFDCHIGSAFASLGSSRDPDILVAAGDMSTGQIQSIGVFPSLRTLPERDRRDTMAMELIESIPNWASVTDMVASTLPGKSLRSRDGIFVTSGREPYGSITELRHGLEARLSVIIPFADLKSVSDMWTLPRFGSGDILAILSSPAGTLLLKIPSDMDPDSFSEVDGAAVGLDSEYPTLAAAVTHDTKIIQITQRSFCLSQGISANFEDCARIDCDPGRWNVAASIFPRGKIALVAQKSEDIDGSYAVISYAIHTDDSAEAEGTQIRPTGSYRCESEPLSVLVTGMGESILTCVATVDGRLTFLSVGLSGVFTLIEQRLIPPSEEGPGMCDSIVALEPVIREGVLTKDIQLVCGLRDGRLYCLTIETVDGFKLGEGRVVEFGRTTVKVTQPPNDYSVAYAMSGVDTCLLTWNDERSTTPTIESIFISDKNEPALAQGPVVACTHLPPAPYLTDTSYAGSLTMVSGVEFLLATLEKQPTIVPRQIAVSGTPNRVIYAEQQRSLVCASMKYGIRTFPSPEKHGAPVERRQIYPVIDFIPSNHDTSSFTHEMQPGERVYALLTWSFRRSPDKVYSFILVGSSHVKSSGAVRGRITFLQPTMDRARTVVDVKEGRTLSFDAPVYALALVDDLKIAVCSGETVQVLGFQEEETKWTAICEPLQLSSPGIHVTTSSNLIYISTNADSVICLELLPPTGEGQPHQLRHRSSGPQAAQLLSHLVIDDPHNDDEAETASMTLSTTKYGQIIALTHPSQNSDPGSATQTLSAQLPRSLTRLRRCDVRPKWKPAPPPGVLVDNILGCATDGTLVGVALIDRKLWRSLTWLQRLCEWSEEVSPHSYKRDEVGYVMAEERLMPIGLAPGGGEVVMRTRKRARDAEGHVDGDVLARVLEGGRRAARVRLEAMIRSAAERRDGVGEWVRGHLEVEIAAAEEVLAELEGVLGCWI